VYVVSHDEQEFDMANMLYARRPGAKLIGVVDDRSDDLRERQDATAAGIYASVRTNKVDDHHRRAAAAEQYRSLGAGTTRLLTTALFYHSKLAWLVTLGEWRVAAAVLHELAPTTPSPQKTHELADALAQLDRQLISA
jgi:hypothetical protein